MCCEFETELVLDGRKLPRPVNYGLVRIMPPKGVKTDPAKRPFVVVDPRAGHGPGIGGMKKDSEIGVALENGHPCYFVGFLPDPMPGQTTEDVWNAEAEFIREVARRHPGSRKAGGDRQLPGRLADDDHGGHPSRRRRAAAARRIAPVILGRRARQEPDALSRAACWAAPGLPACAGDLGEGIFDGANLVANFESLDPANTYFEKPYNVYSKVDTEAERFLDFETWWGSPVLLNAGEMQWIADNLFVGNKLTSGEIRTSRRHPGRPAQHQVADRRLLFLGRQYHAAAAGARLDHRLVRDRRRARRQRANHRLLGARVRRPPRHIRVRQGRDASEHDEFASAMDMIDVMPPGLYEAVIEEVEEGTANRELIDGDYLFRLVPRTLDDIRALGGNSPEDDLKFAAVDRVSEYQPAALRDLSRPAGPRRHAAGLWRLVAQDAPEPGPLLHLLGRKSGDEAVAESGRAGAQGPDSRLPRTIPSRPPKRRWLRPISASLSAFGAARDAMTEQLFHMTYGSPMLQALVGLDPEG